MIDFSIFSQNRGFSFNLNFYKEHKMQMKNFHTISDIILLLFIVFLYKTSSPQVKQNLKSIIINIVFKLQCQQPNNLRLRIVENLEVNRKSLTWVKQEASVQSAIQEQFFCNSSQNLHKSRY